MVKFADETEVANRKQLGYQVIQGEMGEVLINLPGVKLEETLAFSLKSFLMFKDLTVTGVGPLA